MLKCVVLDTLNVKERWPEYLKQSLEEIGWKEVDAQDVEAVSLREIGQMLNCGCGEH